MSADLVLEARELRRSFLVAQGPFRPRRTLHAVNGVSLSVPRGSVLGIVGESGCGKTTLARMLLGLLRPSAGEVRIGGVPLAGLSRLDLARRVQPVFQDPYASLNPRKTVGAIVGLPLAVHGVGMAAERRGKVEAMLERVGLARRLVGRYPNQLSGGQRQRVAIARALIVEPELVICDEPTSALDVSVQAQILNLLQDLRRDLGLTIVLISHNLAVVERVADRVAVMYLGRVVEETATEALFAGARHPYSSALLASVLTPEPGKGIPDVGLGASFPNPLDPPPGCQFHPRCPRALRICSAQPPVSRVSGGARVECHLYDPA